MVRTALFKSVAIGVETIATGRQIHFITKYYDNWDLSQWAEWQEAVNGKFLRGTWLSFKDSVSLAKLSS